MRNMQLRHLEHLKEQGDILALLGILAEATYMGMEDPASRPKALEQIALLHSLLKDYAEKTDHEISKM